MKRSSEIICHTRQHEQETFDWIHWPTAKTLDKTMSLSVFFIKSCTWSFIVRHVLSPSLHKMYSWQRVILRLYKQLCLLLQLVCIWFVLTGTLICIKLKLLLVIFYGLFWTIPVVLLFVIEQPFNLCQHCPRIDSNTLVVKFG